jgi:hypothetical protein
MTTATTTSVTPFVQIWLNLSVYRAEYSLIQSDLFRPPFIIDWTMSFRRPKQSFNISYKRFSAGDSAVLYNILSPYKSTLYNETSADAAVKKLNVDVTKSTDLAVLSGYIKKHKYPVWFSEKLKTFIKKNYFYRRYKKLTDKYSFAVY